MSDLNDILSDEPEQEEPQTEEAVEAEPQAEPEATSPEEPKEPEQSMVPLAALQETRGELQALKGQLAAFQQMQQARAAPEPKPLPDVLEDQQGFVGAFTGQIQQMQRHMQAELSEAKARLKHGDELVDEALQAAQEAGALDQFKGRRDAWGDLAAWHKNQKVAKEIGGDLDGYKAKLREEITAEIKAQLVAENVSAKAAQPAPSLASQPSLGSNTAPQWTGPTSLDDILGG